MDSFDQPISKIISKLNERHKELNCLYSVNSVLKNKHSKIDILFKELFEVLPAGWQYPGVVEVKVVFDGMTFVTAEFKETEWMQHSEIWIGDEKAGSISIAYTQLIRLVNGTQFLNEEQNLLDTIAGRIGEYFLIQSLKKYANSENEISAGITDYLFNLEVSANDKNFHWKWRLRFAQIIADKIDFERFGVKAVYLTGSVKNADSGPGSDIDLLIHCNENAEQHKELQLWIEGWGCALAEFNRRSTGYKSTSSIIDLHIITDEDIKNNNSYALKISAVSDKAKLLK
jgi:predicted nucleotidyltransferase